MDYSSMLPLGKEFNPWGKNSKVIKRVSGQVWKMCFSNYLENFKKYTEIPQVSKWYYPFHSTFSLIISPALSVANIISNNNKRYTHYNMQSGFWKQHLGHLGFRNPPSKKKIRKHKQPIILIYKYINERFPNVQREETDELLASKMIPAKSQTQLSS